MPPLWLPVLVPSWLYVITKLCSGSASQRPPTGASSAVGMRIVLLGLPQNLATFRATWRVALPVAFGAWSAVPLVVDSNPKAAQSSLMALGSASLTLWRRPRLGSASSSQSLVTTVPSETRALGPREMSSYRAPCRILDGPPMIPTSIALSLPAASGG